MAERRVGPGAAGDYQAPPAADSGLAGYNPWVGPNRDPANDPNELPAAARRALAALDRLATDGADALRRLRGDELESAWLAATESLPQDLPPDVRAALVASSGLSPQGLDAALDVVVAGVRTAASRQLLRQTQAPAQPLDPAVVILPSNVPGLSLQCLLPALAARRPLLLKPSRREPVFTPYFVARLSDAEPRLQAAVAWATWPGGDRAVEDAVLGRVERLVAYGGDGALADLRGRRQGPDRLVGHGAKISLALIDPAGLDTERDLAQLAGALARDIALFDQRGCLSVHAVLVLDPDERFVQPLAPALSSALAVLARRWPPGHADAGAVAAVRALREEAVMAGRELEDLPLRHGTVVRHRIGDAPSLESPGLRTVRVVPAVSAEAMLALVEPWHGRIQGVALAPDARDDAREEWRRRLREPLGSLGVTRLAPAGELQQVDAATWHNGGLSPLSIFSP